MSSPKFIEIDGKRFVWRDLLQRRREQLVPAAKAEQPPCSSSRRIAGPCQSAPSPDSTGSPACSTGVLLWLSSHYCAESRASSPCALNMSQSPDPAPATKLVSIID
jgi:hypothetical protein